MTNENPYPGPGTFYSVDKANHFFGRDKEVNDLLTLLLANSLTILHADSGAGKSSLLRAGLMPRLQSIGCEVLPVTRLTGTEDYADSPNFNIFTYNVLLRLWKPVAGDSLLPDAQSWPDDINISDRDLLGMSLKDYLELGDPRTDEYGDPEPRILIIDQFEELFLRYRKHYSSIRDFLQQINMALRNDRNLHVLLALRSDYIGYFDDSYYTEPLRGMLNARIRITDLREQQAFDVIYNPMKETGKDFDSIDTVKFLRDKLRLRGGVDGLDEFVKPILLQAVCKNLWNNLEERQQSIVSVSDVETYDISVVLEEIYERGIIKGSLATLQSELLSPQRLREFVEHELLTRGGRRDILSVDKSETSQKHALEEMKSIGLVVVENKGDRSTYELSHDQFIDVVQRSNRVPRTLLPILYNPTQFKLSSETNNLFERFLSSLGGKPGSDSDIHAGVISSLVEDLYKCNYDNGLRLDPILGGEKLFSQTEPLQPISGVLVFSSSTETNNECERIINIVVQNCRPAVVIGLTSDAHSYPSSGAVFVDISSIEHGSLEYKETLDLIIEVITSEVSIGRLYYTEPPVRQKGSSLYFAQALSKMLQFSTVTPLTVHAITGPEGHGKASLAARLLFNCDIRRLFVDGIIWTKLKYNSDSKLDMSSLVLTLMEFRDQLYNADLDRQATSEQDKRSQVDDLESAVNTLKKLAVGKRILLVLDNLQDRETLDYFIEANVNLTLLITTTKKQIIPEWVDPVDMMYRDNESLTESFGLSEEFGSSEDKRMGAQEILAGSAEILGRINSYLDNDPNMRGFAISLFEYYSEDNYPGLEITDHEVRVTSSNRTAPDSLHELLKILERINENEGKITGSSLFTELVKLLGSTFAYYRSFAVFPIDSDIPIPTVRRLWTQKLSLSLSGVDQLLNWFVRLKILRQNSKLGTVSIHRVFYIHLLQYEPNGAELQNLRSQLSGFIFTDFHFLAARAVLMRDVATVREELDAVPGNDYQLQELKDWFRRSSLLIERSDNIDTALQTLYFSAGSLNTLQGLRDRVISDLNPLHFAPANDQPAPQLAQMVAGAISQSSGVRGIALSRDGHLLVSGTEDGEVSLYNVDNGQRIRSFEGINGQIMHCSISSNGRLVSVAGIFEGLYVWTVETGDLHRKFDHLRPVRSVFFRDDKFVLVTDDSDEKMHIIELDSGKTITTVPGHSCVATEPSWKYIATTVRGKFYLWNAMDFTEIYSLSLIDLGIGNNDEAWGCDLSPNGRYFAIVTMHGTVIIGSTETGKVIHNTSIETGASNQTVSIFSCGFDSESKYLFTSGSNRSVTVWNPESGKKIKELAGHNSAVWGLSTTDTHLFATSSLDSNTAIKIWNIRQLDYKPQSHLSRAWGIAVSQDSSLVASGSLDKTAILWDAHTGKQIRPVYHDSGVSDCIIDSRNNRLFTVCTDSSIHSWDITNVENPKKLGSRQLDAQYIKRIVLSPVNSEFLAVTNDRRIFVLDDTLETKFVIQHTEGLNDASFSPSGKEIIGASDDRNVYIWEIERQKGINSPPVKRLSFDQSVWSCAWHPDGEQIVACTVDTSKERYVTSFKYLSSGRELNDEFVHKSGVNRSLYEPINGKFLVTLEDDGAIHLWDTTTGTRLSSVYLDEALSNFVWYPNGRQLVAAGRHGVFFISINGLLHEGI